MDPDLLQFVHIHLCLCVCVSLYGAGLCLYRYKCGGFSFSLKQKALQTGCPQRVPFSVSSRRSISNLGRERQMWTGILRDRQVEEGKEGESDAQKTGLITLNLAWKGIPSFQPQGLLWPTGKSGTKSEELEKRWEENTETGLLLSLHQ